MLLYSCCLLCSSCMLVYLYFSDIFAIYLCLLGTFRLWKHAILSCIEIVMIFGLKHATFLRMLGIKIISLSSIIHFEWFYMLFITFRSKYFINHLNLSVYACIRVRMVERWQLCCAQRLNRPFLHFSNPAKCVILIPSFACMFYCDLDMLWKILSIIDHKSRFEPSTLMSYVYAVSCFLPCVWVWAPWSAAYFMLIKSGKNYMMFP